MTGQKYHYSGWFFGGLVVGTAISILFSTLIVFELCLICYHAEEGALREYGFLQFGPLVIFGVVAWIGFGRAKRSLAMFLLGTALGTAIPLLVCAQSTYHIFTQNTW